MKTLLIIAAVLFLAPAAQADVGNLDSSARSDITYAGVGEIFLSFDVAWTETVPVEEVENRFPASDSSEGLDRFDEVESEKKEKAAAKEAAKVSGIVTETLSPDGTPSQEVANASRVGLSEKTNPAVAVDVDSSSAGASVFDAALSFLPAGKAE